MNKIKINYQIFNYEIEKLNSLLNNTLFKQNLNSVIFGDFSCIYRINNLLKEHKKFTKIKNILNANNIPFSLQMPLVIKESEMPLSKKIIDEQMNNFDGFLTGDLGFLDYINTSIENKEKKYELTYISNILNKEFSSYLKQNFNLTAIRPLMPKRVFIEEPVDFPKDILVYGNMLLNCSTFCFYLNSTPAPCSLKCKEPKKFTMQKEKIHLNGRSFITDKIWDITDRIPIICDIKYATILDYNLSETDIIKSLSKINDEI